MISNSKVVQRTYEAAENGVYWVGVIRLPGAHDTGDAFVFAGNSRVG